MFRLQRSVTGGGPPAPPTSSPAGVVHECEAAGWIWGVYWGTDASREQGGGRAGRRLKKQGLSG